MTDQHPIDGASALNLYLKLVPMPPFSSVGGVAVGGYAFALCAAVNSRSSLRISIDPFLGIKQVLELLAINLYSVLSFPDQVTFISFDRSSNILRTYHTNRLWCGAGFVCAGLFRLKLALTAHNLQHLTSILRGGNLSQAHLGHSYNQKAKDTKQASANYRKKSVCLRQSYHASYDAKSYECPSNVHEDGKQILRRLEALHRLSPYIAASSARTNTICQCSKSFLT